MKALMLILGVIAFVCAAQADPRMEVRDGFAHFPLDYDDDDIEDFVGGLQPSVKVNGNRADGAVYWTAFAPKEQIPYPIGEDTRFDDETTGFTCNMVATNGVTYASNNWWATVTVSERSAFSVNLVYTIICKNGQAQ